MTRLGRAARSPLVTVLVVSAALAAVVVSGRHAAGDEASPPRAHADDRTGTGVAEFLYGRDCAGCHGPDGEGSPRGVDLTDSGEASAYYMLTTGRMPIDDPGARIQRGPSPYTDAEIAALVDHVAGLGDGPALPGIGGDGDLSRGGVLYRLHCAACHGSTGIGGALVSGAFAPSLARSEPLVVVAAVTSGPGAMPSFAPLGFTDDEVESIVLYVQELRDSNDRGGWPMFRAGRVDEGMVAWLLGVPAVVLFSVWVARRVR